MFVILTDGKAGEEDRVLDLVNQRLRPRMDIVINNLGLGTDVHDQFLHTISSLTGGQYNNVYGLKDLTKIYSKYAIDLEIRGSDETLQEWAQTQRATTGADQQRACPTCGLTLSYIHKVKKWYCYNCQQYV